VCVDSKLLPVILAEWVKDKRCYLGNSNMKRWMTHKVPLLTEPPGSENIVLGKEMPGARFGALMRMLLGVGGFFVSEALSKVLRLRRA